jgi:hypothetical protein
LAIATLISELNSIDDRIQIEINRLKAQLNAEFQFSLERQKISFESEIEIINANLESAKSLRDKALNDLQKEIDDRPSRTFWFGIGAASGIGLTLAILWASSNLSN